MNAFDNTFLAALGGFGETAPFVMQVISIFLYGEPLYMFMCLAAPMVNWLEVRSRRELVRAFRTVPTNNAQEATQLRLAEQNLDGTLHWWFVYVGIIALVCLVPVFQVLIFWSGLKRCLVNVYRSRYVAATVKRMRQMQLV